MKTQLSKARRGQGMTEYIVIVAIIAIAAIGVVTLFGNNIKALFGMSAEALSGNPSVDKRTKDKAEGSEKKTIKNFQENNRGE